MFNLTELQKAVPALNKYSSFLTKQLENPLPSHVQPIPKANFYKKIREFTGHLDELIRLTNSEVIKEGTVAKEATEMQKSLHGARLLFDTMQPNQRDEKTVGTYLEAQNCYYQFVHPAVINFEDLDILYLPEFSFRKNGENFKMIKASEGVENYKKALVTSLQNLLSMVTIKDWYSHELKILQAVLSELTADLVEEAKTLIPPKITPPQTTTETLPATFTNFANDLNKLIAKSKGTGERILNTVGEIHQALYPVKGETKDYYKEITSFLLHTIPEVEHPSETIKMLLLLFLMKKHTSPSYMNDLRTDGELGDAWQKFDEDALGMESSFSPVIEELQRLYNHAKGDINEPLGCVKVDSPLFKLNSPEISEESKLLLGLNSPGFLDKFENLLNQEQKDHAWFEDLQSVGLNIIDTVYEYTKARINLENCPIEDANNIMTFVAYKINQYAEYKKL